MLPRRFWGLPRLVGLSHALDLILTGRKVDATESLRMGLCNRVVPPGQALQAALGLAHEIAAFPLNGSEIKKEWAAR